jgi:hypothetical protein
MKKDRNPRFLSILSQSKKDATQNEIGSESPEMEARRRLEQRIEQALCTLVEAAPVEGGTTEIADLVACDFVALEPAGEELFAPSADFYKPWEHEAPAA